MGVPNMTTVTVAANQKLTVVIGNGTYVYVAADTVSIPTSAVADLRRDGVIV
jgi:hypothetical protein